MSSRIPSLIRWLPDHQLVVIARADDYTFDVLHSRAHELWSLRMGTWLGVGNAPRYTPTSTFETFPFPWPLDTPDEALTAEQRAHRDAIARVALALEETRRRWLNPPELVREESDIVPSLPPRLLPVDKDAERVRPAWLSHLHDRHRCLGARRGLAAVVEGARHQVRCLGRLARKVGCTDGFGWDGGRLPRRANAGGLRTS